MCTDRYITVDAQGVIRLHEENDGYSFLVHGAQAQITEVTLDQLPPILKTQALYLLESRGFKTESP